MNEHRLTVRLLAGVAIMVLVGGCAAGAGASTAPTSPSPSAAAATAAAATPTPTAAVTTTPAPTPSVVVTRDLAYESANPLLTPGVLDVWAPAKAGSWPVVVMFPAVYDDLSVHARKVADLGFVVFVPSWGEGTRAPAPTYDEGLAIQSQAACAVEFARAHALEYGGDPATMVVFGHSSGANAATLGAFARREPTAGCLGGSTPGPIDALVTREGDWVLQTTYMGWDELLAADPRAMTSITPWTYLAEHDDLAVVMLVSENPGANYDRPLPDPEATDAFFAPRDPSGVLRRQLEASGALSDGILDVRESQELLFSVLKAQGNPVSLDVMPGSTHTDLSDAGEKLFLAAFQKAAQRD
jgi:acetyl esterase/lipase